MSSRSPRSASTAKPATTPTYSRSATNGKTVAVMIHGDTSLMERVYGKKELAAG